MDSEENKWSLLYAFSDQSSSFCLGFEAGQIDYRLEHTAECEFEATVHADNVEVFERMAKARGFAVSFAETVPSADEWRQAAFKRLGNIKAKANRHGLRVI